MDSSIPGGSLDLSTASCSRWAQSPGASGAVVELIVWFRSEAPVIKKKQRSLIYVTLILCYCYYYHRLMVYFIQMKT